MTLIDFPSKKLDCALTARVSKFFIVFSCVREILSLERERNELRVLDNCFTPHPDPLPQGEREISCRVSKTSRSVRTCQSKNENRLTRLSTPVFLSRQTDF